MTTRIAVITACCILFTLPALAQDAETLFSGEIEHGGFGGPVLKGGQVNGTPALFVGGRGGWIINHSLILGGGGYGLVNNIDALVPSLYGDRRLEFGYGGIELEYVHHWDQLVHWSVMVLVGGGGVGYRSWDEDVRSTVGPGYPTDEVFVAEPAIQVNLNLTEFFRISAGASYRYVTGVTTPAASNQKLSGGYGVVTFRFGKF